MFSPRVPRRALCWYVQLSAHACADRKSTRLNSSHLVISYAVFCLKKKTQCILLSRVPYLNAHIFEYPDADLAVSENQTVRGSCLLLASRITDKRTNTSLISTGGMT